MIVLSVLLFVFGAAVLVTGLLGLTGKLPGNRWVGLRIPEVRKSREMWTTAHRIVGPFWTGAGVALLVGGLVSLEGGWLWAVAAVLFLGGLGLIGTGAANAAHIMAQIDHQKALGAEQTRAAAGCCSSGSSASAASTASATSAASSTTDAGLVIPPVSRSAGDAATDSCGGSCDDCGACDHDDAGTPTTSGTVPLDLEAARRAMAARDGE
ncbi:SdpI family protein [Corynebacterium terpenotabidum]|uniref:SdpI family protein n=1 Tax=Corynebacterium terpenotabidum Y-11 TaxID=1200352 RepID=S4XHK0_9CORY|nr:SdpI family protein [Corynebacterium terpenotabidum]AGP32001.1 hypothetical protein A606_11810 [Corynebacterium terpenotabidum Y-11]